MAHTVRRISLAGGDRALEEEAMKTRQVSMADMHKRVARFKELRSSSQAFLDSLIPGVTEDASLNPAITDARDFNLALVHAGPGKGAALHAHPTVEVFIALSGRWAVYWGDEGEQEILLEPWDTISVPPGVMRGFRNAGQKEAYLMAILGGTDAGHVVWSPTVLEKAKATGLALDKKGNLVSTART
jgi:mannose-6-phosphate isomerase-like protein (cupin superfamily)